MLFGMYSTNSEHFTFSFPSAWPLQSEQRFCHTDFSLSVFYVVGNLLNKWHFYDRRQSYESLWEKNNTISTRHVSRHIKVIWYPSLKKKIK